MYNQYFVCVAFKIATERTFLKTAKALHCVLGMDKSLLSGREGAPLFEWMRQCHQSMFQFKNRSSNDQNLYNLFKKIFSQNFAIVQIDRFFIPSRYQRYITYTFTSKHNIGTREKQIKEVCTKQYILKSSRCYSGKLCWFNLPRSFIYLFILYFTYIYFCVVTMILCFII